MRYIMALGKQAKILNKTQLKALLGHIQESRNPIRDKVIALLSIKSGLRSKEISQLNWCMVTNASGELADSIALTNSASKGSNGGREVPMNKELRVALLEHFNATDSPNRQPHKPVIVSEQGNRMSAQVITNWFFRIYKELGFKGCSSHSGRRTMITNAAKAIVQAGGSLRDVQQLAGHSSLQTTQRYIEGSSEAKRKVVDMI